MVGGYPRYRNKRHAALALGFRSGLEEKNAEHLRRLQQPVIFEQIKVKYCIPASMHTYTPDFRLRNGIIVETKGRWLTDDRGKMLLVRAQYPGLDIRLVFQRAETPISTGAKTTCAEWADKHGFIWAERLIPLKWIKEPGPEISPEEVLKAGPLGFEFMMKADP